MESRVPGNSPKFNARAKVKAGDVRRTSTSVQLAGRAQGATAVRGEAGVSRCSG